MNDELFPKVGLLPGTLVGRGIFMDYLANKLVQAIAERNFGIKFEEVRSSIIATSGRVRIYFLFRNLLFLPTISKFLLVVSLYEYT